MADPGLTPEHIGPLAAWLIPITATAILVYKKGGNWFKGSFSGIFSLAKMMLTLKEGHERNEKSIADHELRIRDLAWIKGDNENMHTQVSDHESRMRIIEHRLNEDAAIHEQIKGNQERIDKAIESLNSDNKVQSQQLNQIMADTGLMAEQMRSLNQRGEMMADQTQMLIEHLLPPIQNPKKRN